MTPRVLLVEDDFSLRLSLGASLRGAGFYVTAVASAEEATGATRSDRPDVVILDWGLPGASGLALLRDWRREGLTAPVIMLTARDAVADRVAGLESGASDYVTKPFATAELLARVRVQLRDRTRAADAPTRLELEAARVDLDREVVLRDGSETRLTTQEARVLAYLAARPGNTVSRRELLREVWGYRGAVRSRAADNTIFRLRAKIERAPALPRHIITVQGEGYRFEA